jgi:hypothetical protein
MTSRKDYLQHRAATAKAARHLLAGCDPASPDDILEDIRRIAEDVELPSPGSCTRAKYRKYGRLPSSWIEKEFGTHAAALKEAGLQESRQLSSAKRKVAKQVEEESLNAAIIAEVLPHLAKPIHLPKGVERVRAVVGSDFHGPDCDLFALDVFMDTLKRQQPEFVILNGDVLDFWELSRFSHGPNRKLDLQGEIDWTVKNILARARKAAPKARIILVLGNHELRLIKFLVDNAQPLASLRCLTFGELLSLDKYGIELVFNDAMMRDEVETYELEPAKCYFRIGHHIFTHGDSIGKFPAADELRKWGGLSGTSGHVHRCQLMTAPTLTQPYANWLCCPMMAKKGHHGYDFVDIPERWDCGFAIVDIFPDRGVSIQMPILVENGRAVVDGRVYAAKD